MQHTVSYTHPKVRCTEFNSTNFDQLPRTLQKLKGRTMVTAHIGNYANENLLAISISVD